MKCCVPQVKTVKTATPAKRSRYSTHSESIPAFSEQTHVDIAGITLQTLHTLPEISFLSDDELTELCAKLVSFKEAVESVHLQSFFPECVESWNKLNEDVKHEQHKRLALAEAAEKEMNAFTLETVGKKLIQIENDVKVMSERMHKVLAPPSNMEDENELLLSKIRLIVHEELAKFMNDKTNDEDEDKAKDNGKTKDEDEVEDMDEEDNNVA